MVNRVTHTFFLSRDKILLRARWQSANGRLLVAERVCVAGGFYLQIQVSGRFVCVLVSKKVAQFGLHAITYFDLIDYDSAHMHGFNLPK